MNREETRRGGSGLERGHRISLLLFIFSLLHVTAAQAERLRADGEDPQDRELQAEAPDRPLDMPLSVLPEPRSLQLGTPRPAAVEAIDGLVADLTGADPGARERAVRLVPRAKTDWVSGIERWVDRLADRADRKAMKSKFEQIRDLAQARVGSSASDDYLDDVLAFPEPDNEAWRNLVGLLSMNRMLAAIGTADAARVLVFTYSRFGEFIRIDIQHQLDEIGDRADAALIDARRHPAKKISDWATRLLGLRKKLDPHEAVRTEDSLALSEILVALGRSRDPEVTQLLLSFAASDRGIVQQAAREALVLIGDVGSWQLKDAYKDITGRTPPRDWTWKRTARELFTEYDRLKLEKAYALFEQGKAALAEKKYEKAIAAYNEITAEVPFFAQTDELAAGYLQSAHALANTRADVALSAAFRAESLFTDEPQRRRAEALRRLLQARSLRERGWVDQAQLARARSLDPSLDQEKDTVEGSDQSRASWGAASRYAVAISVALVALAGAGWVFASTWLRRPRSESEAKSPED